MGSLKLGQILVTRGLLHPDQLSAALAEQQEVGLRLGMILVQRGYVQEETLIRTLAGQLKLPVARIRGKRVGPEVVECLPGEIAEKHRCLPLFFKQESGRRLLFVAMEDPSDTEAIAEVTRVSGHEIRAVLVGPTELEEALQRHYHWTEMTGESTAWEASQPAEATPGAEREEPALPAAAPHDALDAEAPPPLAPDENEDLELDFDPEWRADADQPARDGEAEIEALARLELAAELGGDLGADLASAEADASDALDFDPQFQLDLPEPQLATPGPAAPTGALPRAESLDPAIILRALSQLLVEKGVITREEFVDRLGQIAAKERSR